MLYFIHKTKITSLFVSSENTLQYSINDQNQIIPGDGKYISEDQMIMSAKYIGN